MASIGKLSIRVFPDTSKFKADLKKDLESIKSSLKASIKVEAELDQTSLAAAKNAIQDASENIKATINADADTGRARIALAALARPQLAQIKVELRGLTAARTALASLAGGNIASKVGSGLSNLFSNLDGISYRVASVGTAVAGLSAVALSAVGSLSTIGSSLVAIAPAALVLPGAFIGAAAGLGVLVAALKDGSTVLADLGPAFSELQDSISGSFWARAADPIREMVGTVLPALEGSLVNIAHQFGGWAVALSNVLSESSALGNLKEILDQTAAAVGRMGNGIGSLLAGFIGLGAAGSQYFPKFANWFNDMASTFEGWVSKVVGSGQIFTWVDGAIANIKLLGSVLGDAFGILGAISTAAAAAGSGGLGGLAAAMDAINQAMNGPAFQGALTTVFQGAYAAISALSPALSALGDAFITLAPLIAQTMGTLGTLLGSVLGAAITALVPVIQSLLTALLPVVTLLGGVLVQAITALAPLLQQMAPVIGAVAATLASVLLGAITQLLPPIMQLVSALIPPLSALFTALVPVITALVAAIAPVVATLISGLVPVLSQLLSTILPPLITVFQMVATTITALAPLLMQIAQALLGLLIPAFQAIMPIVQTVFSVIVSVIQAALDIIMGIVNVFAGLLTGNWSQVWEGILQILSGVWDLITSLISGALDIITSAIQAGMEIARAIWDAAWNAIASLLSAVWTGILEAIQSAISAVQDFISSALSTIQAIWSEGWEAVRSFISTAWENIKSAISAGISNAVSLVSEMPDKIKNALGNLGGLLLDSGKALIGGFIDGIKNMAGAAAEAASGVVKKVRDFFPFSPAKKGPFSGRGYVTYSGKAIVNDFSSSIAAGRQQMARAADAALSGMDFSATAQAPSMVAPATPEPSVPVHEALAGRDDGLASALVTVASALNRLEEVDPRSFMMMKRRAERLV